MQSDWVVVRLLFVGAVVEPGILPDNDRPLLILGFFKGGLRRDEGFWDPFVDDFIDFLIEVSLTLAKDFSADGPLLLISHGDPSMSNIWVKAGI